MIRPLIVLCAFFALGTKAQTVQLAGTVTSTAGGTPVPGAIVSLLQAGLRDTTDAQGRYSLEKTSSAIGVRPASAAALVGRTLELRIDHPTGLAMEVIDARGTVLRQHRIQELSSGLHRIDWYGSEIPHGVLLVRASTGDHSWVFRVGSMDGRILHGTTSEGDAARALALPDTLRVNARGYVTKSVAVPDYQATLDVALSPEATCQPGQGTPAPSTVNISNRDAPLTGSHQVVIETDPSLSGRTIYRPKDLGPGKNYPILVWGNGGCSNNATDHTDFHLEIASHGYVIVADGTPNGTGGRAMVDVATLGAPQIAALDWAIQQNAKPCSRFHQSLDTVHTGGFGWSCGGLMTYGLTLGGRVTTSIIMNSGLLNPDQPTLDKIRTPIAFVCGGSGDMAYPNGQRDYTNIKTVPTVFANVGVGHGGTYYSDNGGEYAKFARAWFDWWLKGDTGTTGKLRFTDPQSPFFKSPWTMQTKRLP
ncbi:MAG: hypothetical protein H6686_09230 [Fibrobacteria bacterium]|nr:hypothetical protein [Fibrobacteria bacterium]